MPRKKVKVSKATPRKATLPDVEQRLPMAKELPALKSLNAGKEKVWRGKIARLRIYDQPGSTGRKVFAYKALGSNSSYVGYSDDPNMIHALFAARDNDTAVTGYSNQQCKIEWMDY